MPAPLFEFIVTVVPPAGTAPTRHNVTASTARHAIATHDRSLASWNIKELQGVARVMVNGTIYVAAPETPTPVSEFPFPTSDELAG